MSAVDEAARERIADLDKRVSEAIEQFKKERDDARDMLSRTTKRLHLLRSIYHAQRNLIDAVAFDSGKTIAVRVCGDCPWYESQACWFPGQDVREVFAKKPPPRGDEHAHGNPWVCPLRDQPATILVRP